MSMNAEALPCALPGSLDDELLARLRRGDDAAYACIAKQHSGVMLRVARQYVSSRATAEDVVQETLLAVWMGVERFEQRCSLKTWMFQILVNKARTASRREHRCVPDSSRVLNTVERPRSSRSSSPVEGTRAQSPVHWKQPPMPWDRAIEDCVIAAGTAQLARAVIAGLPRAQRLVISLRDEACWPAAEVCELLGISAANQRVLLHRARTAVRRQLKMSGDDVTG